MQRSTTKLEAPKLAVMSSVDLGVETGVRAGNSKYFLSFMAVGFMLPLYLLLLSGFPFFDAVKVVTVVLIQIGAGASIWLNIMHPRSVEVVESVGMGLALGSIFGVIGHQLFLSTPIHSFGWLLPVVVASIVHLFSRKNQISRKSFADSEPASLFFVVLAVVVILTQWWWLLPLVLPTGLALYLLSDTGQRKLAGRVRMVWVLFALLFIATTFIMLYLRQLNLDWWIRSWDLQFFDARSYSVATFGSTDNISLIGYPINYHWFGLAWLGSLTIICDLAPWLSVAQIAPVYAALGIGSSILAISNLNSARRFTKYFVLGSFAFASGSFSPANPPNIVSLIWVFAAIVIVSEFVKNQKVKTLVAFLLIAIAAFSSKVSAGYVLLVAFVLTDFWMQRQNIKNISAAFVRGLVLLLSATFAFYYVIGGPNRIGLNFLKLGYKWTGEIFGVENGRGPEIYLLGSFGLLLSLMPLFFGLILSLKFKETFRPINLFCALGLLSIALPSFIMRENLSYFILAAKALISIGCALALTEFDQIQEIKFFLTKKRALFLLSAIIIGVLSNRAFNFDWTQLANTRGGLTPIKVTVLLITYILSWFVVKEFREFDAYRNLSSSRQSNLISFALFILLSVIGSSIFNHVESLSGRAQAANSEQFIAGSKQLKDASNWLKTNAAKTEVLATNRFCLEESSNDCIDPRYFGVSTTSRMRLLIEGPFYVVGYGGDDESLYPKWAKERLDLSRGFADKPTAAITTRLRDLGVDWFYLFLQNTENRDWEPYGTVKYENSEIAIIKLNDK